MSEETSQKRGDWQGAVRQGNLDALAAISAELIKLDYPQEQDPWTVVKKSIKKAEKEWQKKSNI